MICGHFLSAYICLGYLSYSQTSMHVSAPHLLPFLHHEHILGNIVCISFRMDLLHLLVSRLYERFVIHIFRDHSWYGLRQWKTTLQGNVISHWLSPYPECPWNHFCMQNTNCQALLRKTGARMFRNVMPEMSHKLINHGCDSATAIPGMALRNIGSYSTHIIPEPRSEPVYVYPREAEPANDKETNGLWTYQPLLKIVCLTVVMQYTETETKSHWLNRKLSFQLPVQPMRKFRQYDNSVSD